MFKRSPVRLTSNCLLLAAVVLLSAYCLLPSAFARSATATLSGTVEDEKGAVIPDVNITVTNKATGQKRDAVTIKEGYFTVTLLPPITYTVTAFLDNLKPVN